MESFFKKLKFFKEKHTFKKSKIWTSVGRDKRDFQRMGEGIIGMWSEEKGERLMVRVIFVAHRGRWAFDDEHLTDFGIWTLRVFERLRESAWETERVFERLRETVWVGVWNLHVATIFHISGLANWVKRVLKARVSIEYRVFKTRDAINIYCFKTGKLTILLDTLCYLARGF